MREILYIAPMSEFTIKILNSLTRTLKNLVYYIQSADEPVFLDLLNRCL